MQGDDPFCKMKSQDKPSKPQDKPARAPRSKTKAIKKPTKKKTAEPSNVGNDDELDNPDSEVELDSLGSFSYTSLTMIIIRLMRRLATLVM